MNEGVNRFVNPLLRAAVTLELQASLTLGTANKKLILPPEGALSMNTPTPA
jgi:hypothetical protein